MEELCKRVTLNAKTVLALDDNTEYEVVHEHGRNFVYGRDLKKQESTLHFLRTVLLPVPNTKTVQQIDWSDFMAQLGYNAHLDSRITLKDAEERIKNLICSLRSNEPEREGKGGWTKEQMRGLLEDVVSSLDLSEEIIKEHGPLGTEPSVLVRLVLEQKDKQIRMLNNGLKHIGYSDNEIEVFGARAFSAGRTYQNGEHSEYHGGSEHSHPDFNKWYKENKSKLLPSPPLKALSEITDEHCIEISKMVGIGEPDDFTEGREKVIELGKSWVILTFTQGQHKYSFSVLSASQFLQHKGYAVPVFYPVPEVKEKGDSHE